MQMDSSEFLNMLETRKDRMRNDATRLLLNGDTYRAAAAAGAVQCCQELEREVKFRLEAVERMKVMAEESLRKRIANKQARQALKDEAKGRAA